jgi:hypothetical protein
MQVNKHYISCIIEEKFILSWPYVFLNEVSDILKHFWTKAKSYMHALMRFFLDRSRVTNDS